MKKIITIVLVLALCMAAEVAKADFVFGTPTNLGPLVNSSSGDVGPCISTDGLSLYFFSNRPGGYGGEDIWVTTRNTISDPWGEPVNLGPKINSSAHETYSTISADGLSLYFADGVFFKVSPRPGGFGQSDIWVATRETTDDDWGTPVNLGPTINSSAMEEGPNISADGLELFFGSNRPGGSGMHDLWMTTRTTVSDSWGPPVNLGPTVNNSSLDLEPSISTDGLVLFFSSERTGDWDIWVTTRPNVSDPFGPPVNLEPTVNSPGEDASPCISSDGSTLFFFSIRAGGFGQEDLWQVSIMPIVDFNGDGIVDSADICIIVDHWGENYSLCDIGPTPFGDGIVDVQDLIVLAEHLFEEPGLIAYWKLDETEGDVAYDSVAANDAVVIGEAIWQPDAGKVNGTLQFDGIDDYVSTPFILNPYDGSFSVFAWIKGGAPGQVVISQADGADWLCADPLEGNLMTELKGTGRGAAALLSQTNIADGEWHRVGFVWDGAYRTLYVDDVEVAKDAQANLVASENGLYIGAGKAMELGSFWSGLIDEVRIYNRAVTP